MFRKLFLQKARKELLRHADRAIKTTNVTALSYKLDVSSSIDSEPFHLFETAIPGPSEELRWMNHPRHDGDHPFIELGFGTRLIIPVEAELHLISHIPSNPPQNFMVDLLVDSDQVRDRPYKMKTPLRTRRLLGSTSPALPAKHESDLIQEQRNWVRLSSCLAHPNLQVINMPISSEPLASKVIRFQFHRNNGYEPCLAMLHRISLKVMTLIGEK